MITIQDSAFDVSLKIQWIDYVKLLETFCEYMNVHTKEYNDYSKFSHAIVYIEEFLSDAGFVGKQLEMIEEALLVDYQTVAIWK